MSAIAAVALTSVGCASIGTTRDEATGDYSREGVSQGHTRDGLVYFMPRRGFKLTVTVDKTNGASAVITNGDAFPDLSKRFVLSYGENFLGTNKAVVEVTSAGLLTSTDAETTSGLSTVATNLGTLLGDVAGANAGVTKPPPPPDEACQIGQTYTMFIEADEQIDTTAMPLCKRFTVTGGLLAPRGWKRMDDSTRVNTKIRQGGIYYKHDLPYVLTVHDSKYNTRTDYLAYSPNLAEIDFIPSVRTLFADNHTKITLADGQATKLDETSDGEVVGLLDFPAQVIAAYFKAIGGIFASRGTELSGRDTLALAQAKNQACEAAVHANDPAGKKGDELTTAIANIKAACQ